MSLPTVLRKFSSHLPETNIAKSLTGRLNGKNPFNTNGARSLRELAGRIADKLDLRKIS